MENGLATVKTPEKLGATTDNTFNNIASFDAAQRMAIALAKSELIPKVYQNNIPSTMIALELSNRTGVSPIMVMQNLHVIQGRPSWSSSFIIAVINSYKKFSMPLNFEIKGEGESRSCVAFTKGIDGQKYESPEVNIKMAVAEGWMAKPGSKWKTMPDLMLRYRAAAFFGRLYCPELLMGMQTDDEVMDITQYPQPPKEAAEKGRIALLVSDAKTEDDLTSLREQVEGAGELTQEIGDLFNNRLTEIKGK